MKSKIHIEIHIKTFKPLLHISILREHTLFLAKLSIKTISEFLPYINPVGNVAACRVFVCALYLVQREGGCTTHIQTQDMLPHHQVNIMK
jgi:hypothetical protein